MEVIDAAYASVTDGARISLGQADAGAGTRRSERDA